MSNMNPQIQNGFNGGIWASLEGKVQSWGKITNDQDTLYVAKGGLLTIIILSNTLKQIILFQFPNISIWLFYH